MAAERKHDYPQRQVVILPITLWDEAKTETYIRNRITAHELGKDNPPICTSEERWEKPTAYRVVKRGQKRAIRVYLTPEEAAEHAARDERFSVVEREGESVRCKFYCPVVAYCSFGRLQLQDGGDMMR